MPGIEYSLGMPIRRPRTSPVSVPAQSGTARSAEVLSIGSWPAMACSSSAQSSTVRAIGPAWSSELAKATMPQREQRP